MNTEHNTPPADDVREAGARIILDHFHAPDRTHPTWWLNPYEMVDALAEAQLLVRPYGTVTPPSEDVTDPNSGEGWYAWQHMPANTSHIAYVHENGEVYLPEAPGDTDEPFLLAAAAGHVHRLVRADEVRPYGTVTDAEVEAAYRAYISARGFDVKEWIRAALESARKVRS